MKSFYYILLFLGMPFWLLAQTTGQNYIFTTVPIAPVSNPTTLTDANSSSNSNSSIQYFDGLGRPMQTVQKAITPSGKDLVNFTEYDAVGRDYKHWLPAPATGNTGASVNSDDFTGLANTQYTSSEKPYTTTEFESSPLNRVTGQYGAGTAWYTATKKTGLDYKTNAANEVTYFTVNTSNQLVRGNGTTNYYDANTLYKTVATDEDVKPTTEYKDKLGQVVLKRQICNGGNVETYYVYNDLGQLCYVLPPNFIDGMGSTTLFDDANVLLKQFGYLYRYDKHGNCNFKRLPGCEPILMVYDLADRLVASQDGNQKLNDKWTVNKYDVFNRVVYTYIATNSLSEIVSGLGNNPINETPEANETTGGYTLTGGIPVTAMLTVNYYDNYSFIPSGNNLNYDSSQEQNGYTAQYSNAKGLLTGTRVYHLDNPSLFETTALYYDKYGRLVQSRATNHLGGYDLVYNELKFTGAPARTLKTHNIAGQASVVELYTYDYDKAQRPTTTKYSLNSGSTVVLALNTYDELGRLSSKARHTNADTESYAYNIRNWPTSISSGGFTENLYYNANPLNSNVTYNGNISYSTWMYNGATKGYLYDYDGLNRLLSANFKQVSSGLGDGSFDETFTYDKMGNILTLQRKKNNVLIDDLTLHYKNGEKSNQLEWVYDSKLPLGLNSVKEYQNNSTATSNEFAYDANGNITKDLDRNIVAIQYNVLNLPDIIQFKNGNQIKNTYDASGEKLGTEYFTQLTYITPLADGQIKSQSYSPGTVDQTGNAYIGTMEYKTQNGNSSLTAISRIYNDEGYVETPSSPQYYYYRKDHLGDNREVWLANTGETVQRTQYYPSGLPWASNTIDNPGKQQRKYNGKEFVEMHGYDTYDYGARGYYAAMGGWPTMDPLAEKYYSVSPYVYCGGNPVNALDPNGEDYVITIQRNDKNEITGITFSATVYIKGDGASKERASKLNSLAKETFKSNGSLGPNIQFNVNYEYAPDKTEGDLVDGKGQNLLTFTNDKVDRKKGDDSQIYDDRDATHSGYEGKIYNSKGKSSNYDVMHETFHLLGFSDRYDSNTGKPNDRYENDLMGSNGKFDLSPNHYANMYEFVLRQPAFQQHKYLKRISSDVVADQWFKHGNPNKGTLKR